MFEHEAERIENEPTLDYPEVYDDDYYYEHVYDQDTTELNEMDSEVENEQE